MNHLATIVLFVASALTCVRLIYYRRAGARYRWHVSVLAWLLIVSTGTTALNILLGNYADAGAHWGQVGIAVVLCILTFATRGNVAQIIRTQQT